MKKLKIGIIGFAQMHIVTMVDEFLELSDQFEFMGCTDVISPLKPTSKQSSTRKANRIDVLKKCDPIKEYENYIQLLDDEPDLVLVASENSTHGEVACAALERKAHVIIEKPFTTNYSEAKKMVAASLLHNRKLIINWPTTWWAGIRKAYELSQQGEIGRVLRFAYNNGESLGPFSYGQNLTKIEMLQEWWYHREFGGGAMIDYLGYGCNLSRWFLGEKAVAAMAMGRNLITDFADIEDYVSLMLRFPNAQALVEGSWSTLSAGNLPNGPIVYGDEGTIVTLRDGTVQIYKERFLTSPTKSFQEEKLPSNRNNLAKEILHYLNNGEIHPTLGTEINLDGMAAMDAALRSVETQKMELVY